MHIDPGRIINDFIEPNKCQYAIPVYQRNYEWSKEQCVKLFRDIVEAGKKQRNHFCGSIVYAPLPEKNKFHYYIIIDGQQRLTTIYILLKALLDCSETEKEKNGLRESLFNHDKFDAYGVDTASKMKLKPIKSDNYQLSLLMENKYDEIDKSSGIWHNYEWFCQLIHEVITEDFRVSDIYDGIERLTCASIRLDAEDNAQEIFERINSTGIPLSLSDKIRNYVLMTDVNQEYLYEQYWLKSEQMVQKDMMTSFFLDYLNMKNDGFVREAEAYESFKSLFMSGNYTNKSMLEEIYHYAQLYHDFFHGSEKYSKRINYYMDSLKRLKQTTVYLFLFRLFDDLENQVINQTEVEKVLDFILSYSVRRLVCEINSNSLRGLYKTLYNRVFCCEENKKHYYDSFVSFFMQLVSRDGLISDEYFSKSLVNNDLYHKNALCKFLLVSVENAGKEQVVATNLTIEHILPQNPKLSLSWQQMLGENWETDRNRYLHTLGNLTLTAYNSELGDLPFAKKKEKLDETKAVALYEDVKNCDVWNGEAIEKRAEKLAEKIVELFSIEKPVQFVDFNDPRYKEYSCSNPDDATNKTPNYYIFRGERVNATNFSYMLRSLVLRLYELDSSIIENMAKNEETMSAWSQRILFSYDKSKVNDEYAYKLKNTNIYFNQGYSASNIMYIICELLNRYEIGHDEFVYSARTN